VLRKIKSALIGPRTPRQNTVFDLLNPDDRRKALARRLWSDHGILRIFWTNFAEIAPGVYRSNQPDLARLTRYRDIGIKSVLNLRGQSNHPAYVLEAEDCAALGLQMQTISAAARKAPSRDTLLKMFGAFDTLSKPFVIHCKSGADRAGLASALYLLDRSASLTVAKSQLSLRYLHLKRSRTGVQDMFLQVYGERLALGPITIRDWVRDEYDPATLTARFENHRKGVK
jgi:protein tyrosine/serine phosphatase